MGATAVGCPGLRSTVDVGDVAVPAFDEVVDGEAAAAFVGRADRVDAGAAQVAADFDEG